jgi:hypothetical protein
MKAKDQAEAAARRANSHTVGVQTRADQAVVGAYINNQLAAIRLVLAELPKQTPAHREAIKDALECISNAKAVTDILTGVR